MKNVGLGSIIWRLTTSILLGCVSAFTTSISPSFAQSNIVPDETLGATKSSRVIFNFNGAANDAIIGGAERGQNLFHSLREFGVNENRGAYFLTPNANIQNIFARVTGSNASQIFGTLGVRQANNFTPSTANLYLMNPNGVLFGLNARLDVGGSFLATTASGIQFGNSGVYNASGGQPVDVLTINPSAFLFNQISKGNITNRSVAPAGQNLVGENITGLRVPDGKSLLFLGGDINVEGGGLINAPSDGSGGLRAYNGRIELGSLAAPGTVGFNIAGDNWSFNIPEGLERGNISISNGAEINVRGSGGGDIAFTAKDVNISGASIVRAGIDNKLGSPTTFAGDVQINATGTVTLTDEYSRISNVLDQGAIGKSGNINIITGSLTVSKDAVLSVDTFGAGDAGDISILAADKVLVSDGLIASSVRQNSTGNGGNINIIANSLSVTDESWFDANTLGNGNAGNILLKINDAISLSGYSNLDSNVEAGATGNGGNINIEAGSLSITDGTQIQTLVRQRQNELTSGKGNGGNVNINVRGLVNISGTRGRIPSSIRSTSNSEAEGNAGNIRINSDSFYLTDKAQLISSTFGKANAGNISVQVNDLAFFDNGRISSSVGDGAIGDGGNINIKAASLSLINSSLIATGVIGKTDNFSGGQGKGGDINIDVSGKVTLAGASNGIVTEVGAGAIGNGGNVTINTGSLEVTGGSEIQGSVRGKGNSGTITINARDTIRFDGFDSTNFTSRAINSVQQGAEGNAGGINITTGSLFLANKAFLSSSSDGIGNAGIINIDARNSINLDAEARITNDAFKLSQGNAGNIFIKTGSLSLINGGNISANVSGKGEGANININARDSIKLDGVTDNFFSSIESVLIRGGEGKAGNIDITTGSLLISNGARIATNTDGKGDTGNITINVRETVGIDGFGGDSSFPSGITSSIGSEAVGNGGNIRISARALALNNGGVINGNSSGQGKGSSIFVNTSDTVTIDGAGKRVSSAIFSGPYGSPNVDNNIKQGIGGDIQITTGSLSISNGALIDSGVLRQGDGGNILINARNNVSLINNGSINASTTGNGNAGNITINAGDTVTLESININRNSGILNSVYVNGVGKAGDIRITAKNLILNDNALLINGTFGKGDAGNIFLQLSEDILLNNSNIASGVLTGVGNSGNIDISARNVISKSSLITTILAGAIELENLSLPSGRGKAGNININASDSIIVSGTSANGSSTGIASSSQKGTFGAAGNITLKSANIRIADAAVISADTGNEDKGGDININANVFELINGAQIGTSTSDKGNAGNIHLNVKDRITISGSDPTFNQRTALRIEDLRRTGANDERINEALNNNGAASGLFANTLPGSTGNGGSIIIDPREFTISDNGRISVNSEGTGTAGNISVAGGNLTLDKASITARSVSRDGGNIKFTLSDKLVLRRNSEISTTAGTAGTGGDGGNIDINAKFVVAIPKENSNINANAFEGNGGRVQINTQGIFGIIFSPQETDLSDITVSSQFGVSGVADINSPNNSFIPNNLTELNKNTIDTNAIIATSCIARDKKSGTFYFKGSGSLSARPGSAPLSTYSTGSVSNLPETQERRLWKKGDTIVEPQGMYQLPNGKIFMGNECSES